MTKIISIPVYACEDCPYYSREIISTPEKHVKGFKTGSYGVLSTLDGISVKCTKRNYEYVWKPGVGALSIEEVSARLFKSCDMQDAGPLVKMPASEAPRNSSLTLIAYWKKDDKTTIVDFIRFYKDGFYSLTDDIDMPVSETFEWILVPN